MTTAYDENLGEGPAGGFLIFYGFIFIFCCWQFSRRYSNSKALEDRYSLVADFATCLTVGVQILLLVVTEFSENTHAVFSLTALRALLQYCLYAEVCYRWAKLYDGLLPENNHLERNLRYIFVAGGLISLAAFAASVAVALMFTSNQEGFRVAVAIGALPVSIVSIVVCITYIPVAMMLIRAVQEHNQPSDDSEVVAGAQRSSTHRVFYVVAAFTLLYMGGCVVLLIGASSPDHFRENFVDIKSAYLTIDAFSLMMIVYLNARLALRNTIDPPERHCDMLGREIKPVAPKRPTHERKLTERIFGRLGTSHLTGDRAPATSLHSPSSSRFSMSNFSESRAPASAGASATGGGAAASSSAATSRPSSPIPNHSALSRRSSSSFLTSATRGFSLNGAAERSISLTFPSSFTPFVSAKYRAEKAAAIANGTIDRDRDRDREYKEGDDKLTNSKETGRPLGIDIGSDANAQESFEEPGENSSEKSSEKISSQLLPHSNGVEKSTSTSGVSTSDSDTAAPRVSIQIDTPSDDDRRQRSESGAARSRTSTSGLLFSSTPLHNKSSEHSKSSSSSKSSEAAGEKKKGRRFGSRRTRGSFSFSGSISSARSRTTSSGSSSGSSGGGKKKTLTRSASQRAFVDAAASNGVGGPFTSATSRASNPSPSLRHIETSGRATAAVDV